MAAAVMSDSPAEITPSPPAPAMPINRSLAAMRTGEASGVPLKTWGKSVEWRGQRRFSGSISSFRCHDGRADGLQLEDSIRGLLLPLILVDLDQRRERDIEPGMPR